MEIATQSKTTRTRAFIAALGVACLLAGLIVATGVDRANSAPLRIVILGKSSSSHPDCPGKYKNVGTVRQVLAPCLTDGRITAFQVSADGVDRPTRVPFEGKVVSWSVSLGKPSKRDTEKNPNSDGIFTLDEFSFFNDLLGAPATARIAVLRPVVNADVKTFRMVRQSPIETLNPYFGTTPQFVLEHPLTVLPDQVVAITIPTWAPILSSTEPSSSLWRASRKKGACFYPDSADQQKNFVDNSHPQQKVGSKKEYSCTYEGQRLLYTATLIKKPGG